MAIDLAGELSEWFHSREVQKTIDKLVREAIRGEIRAVLDEELLDTSQAAAVLNMTEAAVRKAVERGRIRCLRIGTRLRFRRSELLELRNGGSGPADQ